jgi:NADPH-dependent curcumin reductase CurA
LSLKGFIVSDHLDRQPQFLADMQTWIGEDKIRWKETIVEGIEKAPGAFIGLFEGANFGKMLVKVGPDPAM